MIANPYESPRGTLAEGEAPVVKPALSLWTATGYVFAMSFVGLVFGGLMALAIGAIAPGYYRSLFRGIDDPAFDPTSAGVVLGLLQGLGGGAVLGVAILAIYLWYLTRLRRA
jgi:hypothetical protein